MTEERLTGKITKIKRDDGWGFIQSENMPFTRFHFFWSALLHSTKEFKEVNNGDSVEFTPMKDHNGWHALKIKVL
jgi:cold shock CspA family protein